MSARPGRSAKPRQSLAEVLRGLAALALLLALVLGMPAALIALSEALHPLGTISAANLLGALSRPDDGSLFLAALFLIGWLTWLVFALSVAVEIVAFTRGVATPHLPGLKVAQQGASALVATAALLLSSGTALLAEPVAYAAPIAAVELHRTAGAMPSVVAPPEPQGGIGAVRDSPEQYQQIEVQRHDTLWSLAQTHLGAGARFPEIVALNVGRVQSDGRALDETGWLYPGWTLRLPNGPRLAAPAPPVGNLVANPVELYTVHPGDTLSEIAEDQLGDDRRYVEVFTLNRGHRQPDGLALSDPDEIRSGWHLAMPPNPAMRGEVGPAAPVKPLPPDDHVPPVPPGGPTRLPTPVATSAPERPAIVTSADDFEVPAEALALGLGTVVATGLCWELRRRRRLQQARRPVGARIPMPQAPLAATEAQLAATATPVTIDTVRAALQALMASCLLEGRLLPDVTLIRVSPSTVELTLHQDDPDAVAPFIAVTSRLWQLTGPVNPTTTGTDPYPALLSLGVDGEAVLLLNLESVGALHLVGPDARVQETLQAFALDLAVSPLSAAAMLTFAGCFPDLARALDPGRARQLATAEQADRELVVRLATTQHLLDAAEVSDVRSARSAEVAEDATVPEIVVAAGLVQPGPAAWSGAALITIGDHETAGWRVVLDEGPQARLEPLGLTFEPHQASQDDVAQVLSLLATAQPDDPAPAPAGEDLDEQSVVANAFPEIPEPVGNVVANPVAGVEAAPRVLLLGSVVVERVDDTAVPNRRRRMTELVAYLALHPGASAHEIDAALWPGRRVEKTTRNPFVSRTRQWLGRTTEGEAYLPQIADGQTYRLRPEVSCDWHDFVRLARTGLVNGPDSAGALHAALDLVRGRPFLGVDPASYTWAEADAQEMISAIVDVAHLLSVTCLEGGDHRGAQEAAARGLLAEPCSELLYRDAIRAAQSVGDQREVDRLADSLRHELKLLDPDEELGELTITLLGFSSR